MAKLYGSRDKIELELELIQTQMAQKPMLLAEVGTHVRCEHEWSQAYVIHTTLARKRTGDAEIGWRPAPEKNIETMPCWAAGAKNSPEKCLVDLGRDTRTSTQSRRLVRRKDASWSLNWPSGANLLARKQHMYFFWCLCDYCVLVFLCYWESMN